MRLTRPSDEIPPVGFGPIAPTWPERATKLQKLSRLWDYRAWSQRPLPEEVDAAFFNAAPIDQQIERLQGAEQIALQNLHPNHPLFVTKLAHVAPRAHFARPGAGGEELRLRCDTLSIDTDRGICSVVWRGAVPLRDRAEKGCVVVTAEGEAVGPRGDDATSTLAMGLTGHLNVSRKPALPFVEGPVDAAWPPGKSPEEASGRPAPARSADDIQTITAPLSSMLVEDKTLPFEKLASVAPADRSTPPARPAAGAPLKSVEPVPIPSPAPTIEIDDAPGSVTLPIGWEAAPPSDAVVTPRHMPDPMPPGTSEPRLVDVAQSYNTWPALPEAPPMIGPLAAKELAASSESTPALEPLSPAQSHSEPLLETEPSLDPSGFPVERFAMIAAELAEGRAPRADVLRAHELTERDWSSLERYFADALAKEAARGSQKLQNASDRAYVAAVEGFRGPIQEAEYGRLVVGMERRQANAALDELKIQRPALMPILRLWTKRVAADAKLAKSVIALLSKMRAS